MAGIIQPPFPVFTDSDGDPLNNGAIFVGVKGLNPIANPIQVYWDPELTVTAVQPLTTKGGYPVRAGTPAKVYVPAGGYSILVRNKNNTVLFSALDATDFFNGPQDAILKLDTIADLRAFNPIDPSWSAQVLGYYAVGDGGGGPVRYWDAASVEADNGGSIIRPTAIAVGDPGRWKWDWYGEVNVRWYGATGDGATDDTAALQAALNAHNLIGIVEGEYRTTAMLVKALADESVFIAGYGAIINYDGAEDRSILSLEPAIALSSDIQVSGLKCNGNALANTGIRFFGFGSVNKIAVSNCELTNFSNTANIVSTAGIEVNVQANLVTIDRNIVDSVTRTQVNPGVIAARGIFVGQITGIVDIANNAISNIQSPAGDADADGISLQPQTLGGQHLNTATIRSNTFTNCKGRSVKLQISNCNVYNNTFNYAAADNIISSSNIVEAQTSNGNIHDNVFNIDTTVNGDSIRISAFLVSALANVENILAFRNNKIYLTRTVARMTLIDASAATDGSIDIDGNQVKSTSVAVTIVQAVAMTFGEPATKLEVKIRNNVVPAGNTDALVHFLNFAALRDGVTGPALAAKFHLHLQNNKNLYGGTTAILISPVAGIASTLGMYMQYIYIKDNVNFPQWGCTFKGCDILKLPLGTEFYYDTDSDVGGLINASADGFWRFVYVHVTHNVIMLRQLNGRQLGLQPSTGGVGAMRRWIARDYRNAPPVSNTYVVGDLVWNSAPAVGGYAGWVCTVSGTPGTWAPFGLIV